MEKRQEVILGTILSGTLNARAFTSILKPSYFSEPYKKMAENIWDQVQKYDGIDPSLVIEGTLLNHSDVMRMITNSISLRQAALDYINDFYLDNTNKEVSLMLNKAATQISSGDRFSEVMSKLENDYKELTFRGNIQDRRSSQMIDTIDEIENAMNSGLNLVGASTGYSTWDQYLGGWQPSDLIYLAGRPAMGKTTLSLCLAYETARKGGKVAFITLEMSPNQLRKKLLSTMTGISYQDINRGKLNDHDFNEIYHAASILGDMNIHIENTSSNFDMILDKMYALNDSFGIDLFVIDYMQLMYKDGYKNNRNAEISYMSRALKQAAGNDRLNATILCLSQLNRSNEANAKNRPPSLHNLRDSGSLEQDADAVVFIHRPEYYLDESSPEYESERNKVYAIFEKNRHGETAAIVMQRNNNFSQIYDNMNELP